MNIDRLEVTIKDLAEGYADNAEGGVSGYAGQLDIRPPYQREFVYKEAQRAAVIDTVLKGFPLNVMYWAVHPDGTYEVMDGQQRTISLCQYVQGAFSRDFGDGPKYFHNLTQDMRDKILDYELMVYACEGTDSEKLDWFRTINIAGEKLTDQELRNAVYHGTWLSDAKKYFSRTGCAAYQLGNEHLSGTPLRQELLETALEWVAIRDGISLEKYMAIHQHDPNANDLWLHYQTVLAWTKTVFINVRREMKSVDWGALHHEHHTGRYDGAALEVEVATLMADEDVRKKAGIYTYLLDGKEKHLNIRAFSNQQKREAWERQKGICPDCTEHFDIGDMQADHITPWAKGGKTVPGNCKMRCAECNRRKSDI